MSDERRIRVWVQSREGRAFLSLEWHDPATGRRKSRSAGTADEKEAEDKRADLEADLNAGRHQEAARISWARFREMFEAEYVAPLRRNTRMNYTATLDHFETICKPTALASINERTISQFAAGLRKEPGRSHANEHMLPSTIKVRLQFLHTALSWAVEQKLLLAVPKFPTVKVPAKAPQPVPLEAFEKLLDKAKGDPHLQAYLLCGWLGGLRLNEALSLEWKTGSDKPHLDLDRNRIILPAEFVKAVKDQWLPLDPVLREALEALPRRGSRVFCFVNSRGQELTANGVSQKITKMAKRAGVRMSMKTLRAGFGCRYAGKVSAHVLQRLMRHANIKTTMEYYANIDTAVEDAVLGATRGKQPEGEPKRPDVAPHVSDESVSPPDARQ